MSVVCGGTNSGQPTIFCVGLGWLYLRQYFVLRASGLGSSTAASLHILVHPKTATRPHADCTDVAIRSKHTRRTSRSIRLDVSTIAFVLDSGCLQISEVSRSMRPCGCTAHFSSRVIFSC